MGIVVVGEQANKLGGEEGAVVGEQMSRDV